MEVKITDAKSFASCLVCGSAKEVDAPCFAQIPYVCDECKEAIGFAKKIQSAYSRVPVRPIKTCKTTSTLGVDGILIIGECPECHQRWLNNRDNKFCGGCGVPIDWSKS